MEVMLEALTTITATIIVIIITITIIITIVIITIIQIIKHYIMNKQKLLKVMEIGLRDIELATM